MKAARSSNGCSEWLCKVRGRQPLSSTAFAANCPKKWFVTLSRLCDENPPRVATVEIDATSRVTTLLGFSVHVGVETGKANLVHPRVAALCCLVVGARKATVARLYGMSIVSSRQWRATVVALNDVIH